MLSRLIYAIRKLLWLLGNLRRRLGKPPDYVVFVLEGPYPELPEPRSGFLRRRLFPTRPSLRELSEQLRAVAADPRVRGVVLHLRPLNMPPAQLQTLRDLIGELRSAGKRVVAWSHSYENNSYYVACTADEVLIQPGGFALPLGMHLGFVFLADALKRIGLKAEFIQISPYKSAGDQLSRDSMSDEMREMIGWLMDDVYAGFTRAIAEGRGLDDDGDRALVDNAPYDDLKAVEAGVVDATVSEEDLPSHLASPERPARLAQFEAAHRRLLRRPPDPPGRYVALLRIEGDIVDGRSEGPPSNVPAPLRMFLRQRAGDLSVVQDARRVLRDRRAAAVVVYVDSRGGSSTASEAMAAALQKVAHKKPLVVAMGAVAGSGGYYVATPAHWIVAQPGTLTGSIGVLTGKIANVGLMDRLLMHRETVTRGRRAGIYSGDRPFSQQEREIVWDSISRVYDLFLERVARARKMTAEAVDEVGGGRVWTGRQAEERGLVDELGGLDVALTKARELAGLHPRARVREVPPSKGPLQPPVPQPLALFDYALEGLRMFNRGTPLYLCPLLWDEGLDGL